MLQVTLIDQGVQRELAILPGVLKRSVDAAKLATALQFKRTVENRVSREMDIPKSAFVRAAKRKGARVFAWRSKSEGVGKIWIGYARIKATYVGGATTTGWGRLRQEDWGASARSYFFPGSFLARMKSGHRGIYSRTGVKNASGREKLREEMVHLDRMRDIALSLVDQTERWYQEEVMRQIAKRTGEA